MNKELTYGKLLNKEGNLEEAGFAYSLVREYNRKDIVGGLLRIKEWDYYEFNTPDYGIALTIADNSYMSMVSVGFLDFKNKLSITKSKMNFFTFGKTNLTSTSETGSIYYEGKGVSFRFLNDNGKRHLICEFREFTEFSNFKCDLYVEQTSDKSMVIATPFEKKRHFYYNQKINNLICNGSFFIGEREYKMENALGVLDWGRGVWTYKNTWYWGSCSSKNSNGDYIGFNLGYGFGETDAASENMLFVNQNAYKLDDVAFLIPRDDQGNYKYLEPWKIVSQKGDIDLIFTPILNRNDNMNFVILASIQNQVFGYFNGKIKCGRKYIKFENALGFAERVMNKW